MHVKCNLTELTTRSTCFNLLASGVCEWCVVCTKIHHALGPVCILAWSSAFRVQPFWCVCQLLVCFIQRGRITNVVTQFISGFFPPPFPLMFSLWRCLLSSLPHGAHSWVARISQPNRKLDAHSGSSWVSLAPNLHLATQLLTLFWGPC